MDVHSPGVACRVNGAGARDWVWCKSLWQGLDPPISGQAPNGRRLSADTGGFVVGCSRALANWHPNLATAGYEQVRIHAGVR